MSKLIKKILILMITIAAVSCGGGGGGFSTAPGALKIGNGSGGGFIEGLIALGLNILSSGGSTSLSVSIVDVNGNPIAQAVNVTFSSNCISLGRSLVTSPVITQSGVASTTYTAQGCSGNDVITASATVALNGVNHFLSATGIINVLPPVLGSVEFVSATPINIGLKGSGGAGLPETSVVVFKVKDTNGGVVAGQPVSFALNTTVGGLSVSPISAFSNSLGLVQTVVASGNVATTVRVTATITGTDPPIRTQSGQLSVTTGIPDQNSFSIALAVLNPEAFNFNGVTDRVTLHVSDHFNNPVPDGTAVALTTEGGQVVSSCTTVAGTCSVNWTSSDPKPSDGRVTLLATAIGEESFVDSNGNGLLDASGETFTDLAEAFRDDNEDNVRNPAEEFLDFNANGVFNVADGKYNGLLCTDTARAPGAICDAPKSLHVRKSITLVMSGSEAIITMAGLIQLAQCTTTSAFNNGVVSVNINVKDFRGQVMPAGTKIEVSTTNGTILGDSSFTVPSTSAPGGTSLIVSMQSDATQTTATNTAGTIAFSNANYSIGEGGSATITVNRNGGSAGSVSVAVASAPGVTNPATAGTDFTSLPPTTILTFAPGETSKTIPIPTASDAVVDNNETVALTLSTPTGGATLGTPAAATLTIIEGDSTTTTLPNPPTSAITGGTGLTCSNARTSGLLTVKVTVPSGLVTTQTATVTD